MDIITVGRKLILLDVCSERGVLGRCAGLCAGLLHLRSKSFFNSLKESETSQVASTKSYKICFFLFFLVKLMQNCEHATVKISAHGSGGEGRRRRQLKREIKHTFIRV